MEQLLKGIQEQILDIQAKGLVPVHVYRVVTGDTC